MHRLKLALMKSRGMWYLSPFGSKLLHKAAIEKEMMKQHIQEPESNGLWNYRSFSNVDSILYRLKHHVL